MRALVAVLAALLPRLAELSARIAHRVAELPAGRIVMSFPRAGRLCAAQIVAEPATVAPACAPIMALRVLATALFPENWLPVTCQEPFGEEAKKMAAPRSIGWHFASWRVASRNSQFLIEPSPVLPTQIAAWDCAGP